jgi:ATP-dependent protease HslVU (ClpYQ) peptidase subunit
MTVIAAYDDGERYWIASDSMGTAGDTMYETGSKLITRGNYIIGFSRSYRVADIIRECTDLPDRLLSVRDLRKLRDAIKTKITQDDLVGKYDDKPTDQHPVDIVLISPTGIYTVEGDYQIHKIPHGGYIATGSGTDIALGALFACKKQGIDGKTAVNSAVKAAIKHITSCGGRCYIKSIKRR